MSRTVMLLQRERYIAVGIGPGVRLSLDGLSAQVAVEQLVQHGRLTLPNLAARNACDQAEACRFDPACPFAYRCARHEHGPDCGGC